MPDGSLADPTERGAAMGKQRDRERTLPIASPGPAASSQLLPCIKVRYNSECEATSSFTRLRAYKCRLCRGWHLTRSSQRSRRRKWD